MTISLSAQRLTHIAQESQTNAEFVRIERADGTTVGMTSHVSDITLNSVVYATAAGYTPTAHSKNSDYTSGTVDVEAILDIVNGIDRNDISKGLYDYALIYIFLTDYTNPVVDEHPIYAGRWGKVILKEGRFVTEFMSLKDHLSQPIGRTYTSSCDVVLGGTDCGVRLDVSTWAASTAYTVRSAGDASTGSIVKPTTQNDRFFKCTVAGTSGGTEPTWDTTIGNTTTDGTVTWEAIQATTLTGEATGGSGANIIYVQDRTEAAGYWEYGKITFTSGLNSGQSMEIKDFAYLGGSPTTAKITVFLPFLNDIQGGDQYTIVAGCRKRFSADCTTKFDNADNFRGFPHIPTSDQAQKFGGQ